jgi:hypothetical protein
VDLFTGQTVRAYCERSAQQLYMSDILAHLPVSVLIPLADVFRIFSLIRAVLDEFLATHKCVRSSMPASCGSY